MEFAAEANGRSRIQLWRSQMVSGDMSLGLTVGYAAVLMTTRPSTSGEYSFSHKVTQMVSRMTWSRSTWITRTQREHRRDGMHALNSPWRSQIRTTQASTPLAVSTQSLPIISHRHLMSNFFEIQTHITDSSMKNVTGDSLVSLTYANSIPHTMLVDVRRSRMMKLR